MNHSKTKKLILITGAGGYIGSVMTRFFLDMGFKVRVLDRFYFGEEALNNCMNSPDLEFLKDDTRYVSKKVFNHVDYVIDLASLSNDPAADLDPELTKQINVEGAIRIARLAKENGVSKYIYASSCSVYGKNDGQKLTEESPLFPVSLYAKSKIVVEKELIQLADDNFIVTIGRNATCYGLSPRMRFDLAVNIMTKNAFTEKRIKVDGDGKQWRPFVHIKDVALAYFTFLNSPSEKVQKQIFNVGSNDQNFQMINLADIIKSNFENCKIDIISGNIDKRDYNVSFDKICKILKFKTEHSVTEGVLEIKKALADQTVCNDIRTNTVSYYKYLLEMDNKLDSLKINGKLF